MKCARLVAIAFVFVSFKAVLLAQSAKEQSTAETRITTTVHQMYEAEKRKDLKFVLSHLADDFAEVAGYSRRVSPHTTSSPRFSSLCIAK